MTRPLATFATLAFTITAGCSSITTSNDPPDIEKTTFAASLGVDLKAMTKTASGLYWRDLTVGTGATVAGGSRVAVHYTGWLSHGTQFDENVAPAQPYSFTVGAGQTILGFDEGVRGMKVGGVRQLIIPPWLGYGPQGSGPIPPNAILVFRVEVVSIQ